jgi:hypothetical protein
MQANRAFSQRFQTFVMKAAGDNALPRSIGTRQRQSQQMVHKGAKL